MAEEQTQAESRGFWRTFIGGMADKGHPVYMGLQDKFYPEDMQEKRNREKRMADLALQTAENNAIIQQQNIDNNKLQNEGFILSNLAKKQAMEHAKAQEERNTKLFPYKETQAKAQATQEEVKARAMQHQLWDEEGAQVATIFVDGLKKQIGHDFLNLPGQTIFDNSENLRILTQVIQIFKAYEESDERGDYMLSKSDFTRQVKKDGLPVLVSKDGTREFILTEENINKAMLDIQNGLKNDIAASYLIGGDAQSLDEYATKNILEQPNTKQVFGTYGNAVGEYNQFLNSNISIGQGKVVPRFSKEDKLGHLLSRTLQGAIIDGKISQQEMQQLTPLFAMTVKKMGGEVIFGNDVATSKIKLANGVEVPLTKFANDIAERDKIMYEWNKHVNAIYEQKAKNNTLGGDSEESPESKQAGIDLGNMYGAEYDRLRNADRKKIKKVHNGTMAELSEAMQRRGVKTIKELPLEVLRILDDNWIKDIEDQDLDEKKFYSPYQDEIFKKEIALLNEEKAPLIAELRELEKTTSEYQEYLHGRRGPNQKQKKLEKLKGKVDKINDAIKMRKNKLESRGIKIEDNK